MKAKFAAALGLGLLVASACTMSPKSDDEKASYAIGTQVGGSLLRVKDKIQVSSVIEAIKDKIGGKPARLSDDDAKMAITNLQMSMQNPAASSPDAPTMDKTGYAIGMQIGTGLARFKDDVVLGQVISGLKDKVEGKELKLTDQDMGAAMQAFQQKVGAAQAEQAKAEGAKNLADGQAFLDKNKLNPKVKVTKSGLQYEVLVAGTGKKPKLTDTVQVNYSGKLVDGTEFDSSYKRGVPAEFPVGGVIPGWTEALQMMPVGSKWHIVLPGAIAYGERGAGAQIGPDAVLQFDVELLKITKSGK
jgi:FKBP-type peptidyl-prolyl cis-trans isomerase FklB